MRTSVISERKNNYEVITNNRTQEQLWGISNIRTQEQLWGHH